MPNSKFLQSAHYDATNTFVTLNLTQSSFIYMVFLESRRLKTFCLHPIVALSLEVTLLHEETEDLPSNLKV